MTRPCHRQRLTRASLAGFFLVSAMAVVALAHGDALAEELATETEVEPTRWVRSASMAIRGLPPAADEFDAVVAAEDSGDQATLDAVVAELVDGWLRTPEFGERVVRLHRELFWNNVEGEDLLVNSARLSGPGSASPAWTRLGATARLYRGGRVPCLDEPATFDADGNIVTRRVGDSNREGWVWVRPFWDPDNPVRACAFDAQENLFSANGVSCAVAPEAHREATCGCGPNLRWCARNDQATVVLKSFAEDLNRRVQAVIESDAPYLDLFASTRGWVNGPIVHYAKHFRHVTSSRTWPTYVDIDRLPDLGFHEVDTWVEVDLGDQHAGALTSPAYLLRFQTDRARANQFYTSFLCQPFNAPVGGLPVADEAALNEPDLQIRAGCNYCHALLEPAAAHWARWGERGTAYLAPDRFPAFDPACELCATSALVCPQRCVDDYVIRPTVAAENVWVGWLHGYMFRRPDHMAAIEQGPSRLAYQGAVDGRLPQCVAKTAVAKLFGPELGAGDELMTELSRRFVFSGFRYREVIRELVLNATYRRVR